MQARDTHDPFTEFVHRHAPHLVGRITEDTLLIEQGLLNSLLLVTLVAFLERTYRITVPDEEIVPDNFANLPAIRALVQRLAAQQAVAGGA